MRRTAVIVGTACRIRPSGWTRYRNGRRVTMFPLAAVVILTGAAPVLNRTMFCDCTSRNRCRALEADAERAACRAAALRKCRCAA